MEKIYEPKEEEFIQDLLSMIHVFSCHLRIA